MKEKAKRIGLIILINLAILFYGIPLLTAFAGKIFPIPVHQNAEYIQKIELLDTNSREFAVLRSLEGPQIAAFMQQLTSIKAGRYVNDPPTELGPLTVKIVYYDGAEDYIGSDICQYYDDSGSEKSRGWYYVGREELYELFCSYVDSKLLPDQNK